MALMEEFPFASFRVGKFGDGAVATSQPLASRAGIAVLEKGGSAVDAVLAAAATLTVVEPTMNGLGGDLYALVHDGKELHGLNASGKSARNWDTSQLAGLTSMPETGWHPVTTPGLVRGWEALHQRFGKLAWGDLFTSAIRYGRDGFLVPHVIASQWAGQIPWFQDSRTFRATFMPNGRAPKAGERFYHPLLAKSLERLAEKGADEFYTGHLAERLLAFSKADGGFLSEEDLANCQATWVKPISMDYAGATVHELPPNGQGLAALLALGMLQRLGEPGADMAEGDRQHLLIEAVRRARLVAAETVADPDHMTHDVADLLREATITSLADSIDRKKALSLDTPKHSGWGTVYLCAADSSGLMVSLIQSNYRGFGSGLVVPDTGVALHNRGSCFVLKPGHPNVAAPNKQPLNTIIPGFVTKGSEALAAFGVMGGGMQPQGHVQVMSRMLGLGLRPQAAIDGPRWRINDDGSIFIEAAAGVDLIADLAARGHNLVVKPRWDQSFGSSQIIMRAGDGYEAATESRRDGDALVI